MSDRERANLAFVENWIDLHNSDPQRMVAECYAPGAVIVVPGVEEFGVARLRELEAEGAAAAIERKTRALRVVGSGDVVAVEGVTRATIAGEAAGESSTEETYWCVLLTLRDGLIVSDHAYLNSPGIRSD
ncbi:nuclear transport factor 2 family protein [Streptomyces angustmyceticus]|uniref:nuclear transport factor 2 family protein n=1 Tax=Streptomyces angustmyceticus TaxID=285578 RepID=UPI0021AED755|nr:nuclear transport factor 2 family protein [Streptomyces angustmyceticus]